MLSFSHSPLTAAISSFLFAGRGARFLTCRSKRPQRCSIGFKSGLCPTHGRTGTLCVSSQQVYIPIGNKELCPAGMLVRLDVQRQGTSDFASMLTYVVESIVSSTTSKGPTSVHPK